MKGTIMLGLLLGFSVVANLIILKRLWVTNTRLDLLVKLLDMPGTLVQVNDVRQLSLILRRANIKSLLLLQKLSQKERYKFFILSSQKFNGYSRTELLNVLKRVDALLLRSRMESTAKSVELGHSLKDMGKIYSDKDLVISHKELFRIIPRPRG